MGLPNRLPPALCRYVVEIRNVEYRTLPDKNQEPDSADQQQQLQDPSPSAEANPAPHGTGTLADALPQAILGTGTLLLFDSRSLSEVRENGDG